MSATATARPTADRAFDTLRRAGNPFRNYFARNPDDEVCARYHVPELFSPRAAISFSAWWISIATTPARTRKSCRSSATRARGKTHLLHSIKHGTDGAWQLLVTPGVYQKDTDFLEYMLYQIIDTLLGGGRQKGVRPLDHVGDELSAPAAWTGLERDAGRGTGRLIPGPRHRQVGPTIRLRRQRRRMPIGPPGSSIRSPPGQRSAGRR